MDTTKGMDKEISLKEYMESRFESLMEYMEYRFESLAIVSKITSDIMERRLEGMNKFRGQLKDQEQQYITQKEYVGYKEKMDSDIRILREYKAELQAKANQSTVIISIAISIISLFAGIGGMIIRLIIK